MTDFFQSVCSCLLNEVYSNQYPIFCILIILIILIVHFSIWFIFVILFLAHFHISLYFSLIFSFLLFRSFDDDAERFGCEVHGFDPTGLLWRQGMHGKDYSGIDYAKVRHL